MNTHRPEHVTVIGGGITGLATAFYLQERARERKRPIAMTLVEAEPRLGGKIITDREDDFVIEGGPDSFITQKPWGLQLCRDLGLADRLLPCNEAAQSVYLLHRGRLVPLPEGLRLTVPTRMMPFLRTPLLSPLGKLRMGMDLFIPPRTDEGDESLASFVRRRLGAEALRTFAAPIMGGIYVSDPERMSMKSTFPMFLDLEKKYGSLIRAMLARKKAHRQHAAAPTPAMFMSLRGGMQELVDALTARLQGELRTGCRVSGLGRRPAGLSVRMVNPPGDTINTDAIVLATPASVSARLLSTLHPALSRELQTIHYVSTAVICLAYRARDLSRSTGLRGFGFLVPRSEHRLILACTCSSLKFAHRAPSGDMLLRVFVGGPHHEELVSRTDEQLLTLARDELRHIAGVTAPPYRHRIYRWPRGNPQFDVGHLDRVAHIEKLAAEVPGLFLAGSSYRGVGIPDCVHSAGTTAERILNP